MGEIIVHVVKRKDRKALSLRWVDPVTGQRHEKSSRTTSKRQANKAAGKLQDELNRGVDTRGKVMTWDEFRERYEGDHASQLKGSSELDIATVFNVIEDRMKPDKLSRITPQWLTRFVNLRKAEGRAASTIDGDLRQLKAAMRWAKDQGYLKTVPKFPKLKNARKRKAMKGRPITTEEFERMLLAVEKLKERQHASMKFLLRGLWCSGLRIGEAMNLTWDKWGDGIRVDMAGEFTVLLIRAEDEKGGKDREYPVAPEFEALLKTVPEDERRGWVFNPVLHRGVCRRADTVSKTIVALGESANIKVDERAARKPGPDDPKTVPVYASAHDLRRAFGTRWAMRVKPMVLKELMRHESVTTTEKYYVGLEAQETARFLREVVSEAEKVTVEVTVDEKSGSAERQTA